MIFETKISRDLTLTLALTLTLTFIIIETLNLSTILEIFDFLIFFGAKDSRSCLHQKFIFFITLSSTASLLAVIFPLIQPEKCLCTGKNSSLQMMSIGQEYIFNNVKIEHYTINLKE